MRCHLTLRALKLTLSAWAGLLLFSLSMPLAWAQVGGSPPTVIRTFTHHQITSMPQGVDAFEPVISDTGNRIVFGTAGSNGQPDKLAAIDADGGNLQILDDRLNVVQADLSADGSRIVWLAKYGGSLRVADAAGTRTLLDPGDGGFCCARITGDGQIIYLVCISGTDLTFNGQRNHYDRGIYAINFDGTNFRPVVGINEIAKLLNVNPDDVGPTNHFNLAFAPGTMDVSTHGAVVAFGCTVNNKGSFLFGCDGKGQGLHTIQVRTSPPGGPFNQFNAIALSNDGTTVAYHAGYPDEVGVVGFSGNGGVSLLKESEEPNFPWIFGEPVYITADGGHVTYVGRHFNSDGSGSFQLMKTHQTGVLAYVEYETPAMDAQGRRFAYWMHSGNPMQVATMELNVPWNQLRAPQISNIHVDPAIIIREKANINITPETISALVSGEPAKLSVTASGFRNGLYDNTMNQGGLHGNDMLDDGNPDHGDAKAGDGIYSRRCLSAVVNAPDGPRSIRIEAQLPSADQLLHASVVEVGYFPLGDQPAAGGGGVTIAGTPPAPPTPKSTSDGNSPLTNGGGTSTGTGTVGSGTTGGAIDLTGFWTTEAGGTYYVKQIGSAVYWDYDHLPKVHNVFVGTITGDTLTGTWVDLPGGANHETGTLSLKINSNDKLTKTSSTIAYDGTTWTRIAGPPGGGAGAGVGGVGVGPGDGGGGTLQPWDTTVGQAAFEQWIAVAMGKLNAYDGGPEFNSRKPWSINKYGLLAGHNLGSAFAPDNFKDYKYNRDWYMWDHYLTGSTGWSDPNWNAAGVPPLREFVTKAIANARH